MRLPSTRQLAEHLKVSRSTTQLAYEQLVSEGYLEAIPRKGYFPALSGRAFGSGGGQLGKKKKRKSFLRDRKDTGRGTVL